MTLRRYPLIRKYLSLDLPLPLHVKLGLLGSEKVFKASPAVIDVPSKDGLPAVKFTLVNNPGLLRLSCLDAK